MNYEQWKQFAEQMEPMTRHVTLELINICSNTQFCDNCKMRTGCPYRVDFYLDEQYFELALQTAELKALSTHKKLTGKEVSDEITNLISMQFRIKRLCELQRHPYYSYE